MCKRIKKLDLLFSQKIHLTYERSIHFKTVTGGVFTLLLVVILSSYTLNGLISVIGREVTSLSKEKRYLWNSDDHDKGFSLGGGHTEFNMAFGFENELDPTYGHWEV